MKEEAAPVPEWWKRMNPSAQKEYIKLHPETKYKPSSGGWGWGGQHETVRSASNLTLETLVEIINSFSKSLRFATGTKRIAKLGEIEFYPFVYIGESHTKKAAFARLYIKLEKALEEKGIDVNLDYYRHSQEIEIQSDGKEYLISCAVGAVRVAPIKDKVEE